MVKMVTMTLYAELWFPVKFSSQILTKFPGPPWSDNSVSFDRWHVELTFVVCITTVHISAACGRFCDVLCRALDHVVACVIGVLWISCWVMSQCTWICLSVTSTIQLWASFWLFLSPSPCPGPAHSFSRLTGGLVQRAFVSEHLNGGKKIKCFLCFIFPSPLGIAGCCARPWSQLRGTKGEPLERRWSWAWPNLLQATFRYYSTLPSCFSGGDWFRFGNQESALVVSLFAYCLGEATLGAHLVLRWNNDTLWSYIKSFRGLKELWIFVVISVISMPSSGRRESAGSKLPL